MTTREKAIVSAFTGFLMCDMTEMLKYLSEKLGFEITEQYLTSHHEDYVFGQKLAQKVLPDWLSLCEGDAESKDKASWWR